MTIIGIVLLAVGLVAVASLVLADPVLLSRIGGEPAEGASGRHVQAPPITRGAEEPSPVAGRVPAGTARAVAEPAPAAGPVPGAAVVPLPRRPGDHEPQAA
ncbi:hypothetical protein GCM10010466_16370 [Planomonospora alba]|uniref:Uncharacterized protein n=1 Tax=Planomonospora alba TaxID=161354 RepID=A0ABP6MVM7_9ACTN